MAAAVLVVGGPAQATLGGGVASVGRDALALGAAIHGRRADARYTVHELEGKSLIVREYANPAGRIFAITWHSVRQPDLAPLLGDYAADYRAARAAETADHEHHAVIRGSSIEVILSGHMPEVRGAAVAVALVPGGVDVRALE